MEKIIAIFIGGGLGSTLRWLISSISAKYIRNDFPFGTFAINIIGCFLLSFFICFLFKKFNLSKELGLLLTAGFCGSFTTMSTFAFELFNLYEARKIAYMLIYLFFTIIFSIAAAFLGGYIAKWIN